MKQIAIFDLDNCIADDKHRIHLIDYKKSVDERYHDYHSRCHLDLACNTSVLEEHILSGHDIVFCTGRPERYREETEAWISNNIALTYNPVVLMRADGDHRPARLVKEDLLMQIEEGEIIYAYDDRDDIVEHYRSLGLKGVKLAINDYFHIEREEPIFEKHEVHNAEQVKISRFPDTNILEHFRTAAIEGLGKATQENFKQFKEPFLETSKRPQTVPELLRAGADTYEARNVLYGNNYKNFGNVFMALFPADSLSLTTPEQINRLGLTVMIISKLSRYCANFKEGHKDSAHDLMVYAAMLEELTQDDCPF